MSLAKISPSVSSFAGGDRMPRVVVVNGGNLSSKSARFFADEYEMFLFFDEEQAEVFLMSLKDDEIPNLMVLSASCSNLCAAFKMVKFLNRNKRFQKIPFVVISNKWESGFRQTCFEKGAKDCIENQATNRELKVRIDKVLACEAAVKNLEGKVEEQSLLTKKSEERLAKATIQIVDALLSTIAASDSYTKGHSTRVRDTSVALAREIGYPAEKMPWLANAALLHDIGKLGVDKGILKNPKSLSNTEFKKIKEHPKVGCEILAKIENFKTETDVCLHHHERWDGNGYPEGLKGKKISLESRIVAIADAYDVMKVGRRYQSPKTKEEIAEEIERCAGTQFDPYLAKRFAELVRSGKIA